MDGVIADFVRGSCAKFGKTYEGTYGDREDKGEHLWGISEVFDISDGEFWGALEDDLFWETLPPTPEFQGIVSTLEYTFGPENICILSSPPNGPAMVGKYRWIERHMPNYRKRFLFGSAKEFMAHEGAVLVDDHTNNVDKFIANGGQAILVPRPWNRLHAEEDRLVEYIKSRCEGIVPTQRSLEFVTDV